VIVLPIHHPDDKGYKQLLANKQTFRELLQTFVGEDWAQEIAEQDLILINKSYILQDFSDKEADIIYKLRLRESEVIFYVLLELQSTVDQTMPFRLLQYMVEIWRDIYQNTPARERRRKVFRLPAIIPAVLYNGERKWTARRSFKEYQNGYERFPGHLLDFSYILFDVVRYNEQELRQAANVVSSVFYLEQTADPPDLAERLKKLADVLAGLTSEQFRQVVIWLKSASERKLPEPLRAEVDQILDETRNQEVTMMISNVERALDKMQKQALMNGKAEVAMAALKKGFSLDDVIEITGLSRDAVLEMKKELAN
jgi:predicted transposase/invertase (TIGR01784 family)